MKFIKDSKSVYLIAGIMIIMATALFFVVPISLTFFIAYGFTMFAICLFAWGSLQLLDNTKSYPWFAAFPMRIWQYLATQFVLSAAFVMWENFTANALPLGLFFFLHIVILGFFAISLVLMKTGQEIIETREAEVKQKVSTLRMLQADVESIIRQHPLHEKPLRQVFDALRYSDPMSHPSVGIYEEQIQRGIFSMMGIEGNDPANIPEICEKLLLQIEDRNSRVKMMK